MTEPPEPPVSAPSAVDRARSGEGESDGRSPSSCLLLAVALGIIGLIAGYLGIGLMVVSATGGGAQHGSIGAVLLLVAAGSIATAISLVVYSVVVAIQRSAARRRSIRPP